jgi:hypothetical protein
MNDQVHVMLCWEPEFNSLKVRSETGNYEKSKPNLNYMLALENGP